MSKYRNKISEVDAYQWQGDLATLLAFMDNKNLSVDLTDPTQNNARICIVARTRGLVVVPYDGWIIKTPDGGFDAMSNETFEKYYEVVPDEPIGGDDNENGNTGD